MMYADRLGATFFVVPDGFFVTHDQAGEKE